MIKPMQDRQASTSNINGAFAWLADDKLPAITGAFERMTSKIEEFVETLDRMGFMGAVGEMATPR
jgi:hypothetical protein